MLRPYVIILLTLVIHSVTFGQNKKKAVVACFEIPYNLDMGEYSSNNTLYKMTVLFENNLQNLGMYELIDRAWLGIGIDEDILDDNGAYSKQYMAKLKDVDYLITGTLSGFSTKKYEDEVKKSQSQSYKVTQEVRISLTIKCIDITTGRIFFSSTDSAETISNNEHTYSIFNQLEVDTKLIDSTSEKVVSKLINHISEYSKKQN